MALEVWARSSRSRNPKADIRLRSFARQHQRTAMPKTLPQTICLETSGMGIVFHSPWATSNIAQGEDFLSSSFSNPAVGQDSTGAHTMTPASFTGMFMWKMWRTPQTPRKPTGLLRMTRSKKDGTGRLRAINAGVTPLSTSSSAGTATRFSLLGT